MSDMRVVEQRLTAIERDVSFLAQMVGLVIVDQATRMDVARLSEMGSRPWRPDIELDRDDSGPPYDDLTKPARPA